MSVPSIENPESPIAENIRDYSALNADYEEFWRINTQFSEAMTGESVEQLPDGYEIVVPEADLALYDVNTNLALVLQEYGVEAKLIKSKQDSTNNSIAKVGIALPKEVVSLWKTLTSPELQDGATTSEPLIPLKVASAISKGGDSEVASMFFVGDRYASMNKFAVPNEHTLWATHYFRNIELVPMQALLVKAIKNPGKLIGDQMAQYEFLSEIYGEQDRKRTWGETIYNLCNLAVLARLADNPELIERYNLSHNPESVKSAHDVVHMTDEKFAEASDIYTLSGTDEGVAALRAISFAKRRR